MASEGGCTETRAEPIALLAVEVDAEGLGVEHCAETRLAVAGAEVVAVVGDVAQQVERPVG